MNFIAIMFCPYLILKSFYNIKYHTLAYNVNFTDAKTDGVNQMIGCVHYVYCTLLEKEIHLTHLSSLSQGSEKYA